MPKIVRENVKIPLTVIPEPEPNTRAVLVIQGDLPAFRGEGNVDFICGNKECGQILVESVGRGIWMKNLVIRCPKCKSFNEIP